MKNMALLFLLIGVIILAGCGQTGVEVNSNTGVINNDGELVCTAEAKMCPDGSFVGRDSENNCEYVACPELVICDATTQCLENYDCYKFEGQESAICYQGNPCFQCDSHQCMIAESYPMQIFCE